MRDVNMLFLLLLLSVAIMGQTCYYPDKSEAKYNDIVDIPCNASNTGNSACCTPGDACTTTGLCVGHAGMYYRAGCTTIDWQTDICIDIPCQDQSPGTFSNLVVCPGQSGWCCAGPTNGVECCNNTSSISTDAIFGDVFLSDTEHSVSLGSTSSTGVSSTPTVQAPAASSLASSSAGHSVHIATTVGLAVGLPLGILFLAVIGVLIWREHKANKYRRVTQQQSTTEIGKRVKALENLLMHTSRAELSGLDERTRTWHELSNEALYELAANVGPQEDTQRSYFMK